MFMLGQGQIKIVQKICFRSITSKSFGRFSYNLAQVSTITRQCVAYMTQVCMSMVKVIQVNVKWKIHMLSIDFHITWHKCSP